MSFLDLSYLFTGLGLGNKTELLAAEGRTRFSDEGESRPSPMRCQNCRGAMRRRFNVNGYHVCACESCEHESAEVMASAQHISQVYDDQYFFGGGAGYTNYLAESNLLLKHGRRYAKLLSQYMKPGLMLDVGSAAGFLLKGFTEAGWDGRGIEPNAQMAEHARTQLGLRVEAGALETFASDERYDLITMIQVIAHFVNLERAFEVVSEQLAPKGFVLIESWDRESWTARILGQRWHEYSPPSVVHWFSRDGLKQFGARFGLSAVAAGRPAKWLDGAHARSLLSYKLGTSSFGRAVSGLTRVIPSRMPILYPAEDLFWMLFQKD